MLESGLYRNPICLTDQSSLWLQHYYTKFRFLGLNRDTTYFQFPLGYHYNLSLHFGPSASVHGISYSG